MYSRPTLVVTVFIKMQTSGTCADERYHYQVSAQNKSFEDCPINHLRMPTPFHTMTKKSIKTKSPVADILTFWRERIQHPLQFHHHHKLLIIMPLPECQLNPTSSAAPPQVASHVCHGQNVKSKCQWV
jgi:hypothetical protein